MKICLLFLFAFFTSFCGVSAQHEIDNWFFGKKAGIKFLNNQPITNPDGHVNTGEGSASISDKATGELLFYTDGVTIWNRKHQIMNNGSGLLSGWSSTQNSLIVPHPGNKLLYYVFTVPDLSSPGQPIPKTTKLLYSIVSLQNPDGDVIVKNISLVDGVSEKLTGTLDCSGDGFWVVTHSRYENTFYSFHITASGIKSVPVVSNYSDVKLNHTVGFLKISPDGSKLVLAEHSAYSYNSSLAALFDFNARNGAVTNYNYLSKDGKSYYGATFSPDNTKLYLTGDYPTSFLCQYDLKVDNIDSIRNSRVDIGKSVGALQLGPNQKIYKSIPSVTYLEVIESPNLKGLSCNYHVDTVPLNGQCAWGLPNFMDYYSNVPRGTDTIRLCNNNKAAQIGLSTKQGCIYQWSPSTGLSDSTIANPYIFPSSVTDYTLKIINDNSCENVKIFTYKILVAPKPTIDSIPPICKGESIQLSASEGDSYIWFPVTGLDNPTIANPIASPSVTTKYRVLVTTANCIDSAFITVYIDSSLHPNAGKDTTICFGGNTQLGALPEGKNTYSWQPIIGLDNPTVSNPICSPNKTTRYILTVTNELGCSEDDTVLVTINKTSVHVGDDKTVCTGATVQLGIQHEAGNIYSWQPPVNLDNPNISNPICTPISGTTQYILTVTNAAGCIAYDTVLVTVGNIIAKVSNDTMVCTGSRVQLSASGGSGYEWTPTTGLDNPSIPNPIASPTVSTTYKVRVSSGSCEDFDSVTVTVSPIPIANAGADLTVCVGEPSVLGAPPQDGNTYQWQPTTGLDNPTKSNPIATPTVTTEYILTVTNSSGCTATDTVLVTVGNIKAIASGDTTICSGSQVMLSASGGTTYQWSPSTGLDNPNSANPICTVNSTTPYTVIVSSGLCFDTAFVTVNIAPQPIAYAGQDMVICIGEQTTIGAPEIMGNTYSWTPQTGLANPNASQTDASPLMNTQYILKVTNSSGCINYDTVLVTVNPANERLFTLSPSIIDILPGEQFSSSLNIPGGVQSWKILLDYDNLVARFNSILRSSNGIMATALDTNSQLSISGKGGNGTVELGFSTFLPYNSDTTFAMKLTVDSAETALCETVAARGNILDLGVFCGRTIRTVSSTGKKFFLRNKDNGLNFGVGLSGKVRLELYDYTGTLKEILVDSGLEAGEYSIDFDLPTGMYLCRMSAGMYEEVEKVVIVR